MASRITGMLLGVGAVGALVGALALGLRPQAQEAGDTRDEVSAGELQLYIDVSTAMQADHSLTLDQALAQKNVSLDQFRNIERRVQRDDRLVRKVRDALAAQAKQRAAGVAPLAANPAATAASATHASP
ncbi:MAG: hypothetical protein SF182_24805 [Deltaproteobacteria bacterium]|nr:hypothetical protein [Deltaproteobacteria bacterium]